MIGQSAYQSPPQPPSTNSSQQTLNSNSSGGGGGGNGSSTATDNIINNHHSHDSNNMQIASASSLIGSLSSAHAGMVPHQASAAAADQRRPSAKAPHPSQPLKCPRCDSLDTKFCYYNNYSLTQPRYFCKNCKRYWTAGGALRNVPVGGGLRKNKRTKLKLAAAASASSDIPDTIAAAQAFAASAQNINKTTTDNSAIRRVPESKAANTYGGADNVPAAPPLLSGSAIPAPASLAAIDQGPASLYNQLNSNRIRPPANDIGAISDAASTIDYSTANSTGCVVDQNGCPMPAPGNTHHPHLTGAASVFYGAEPRQFYATTSSLIGEPATDSSQQTAAMGSTLPDNASGYGGMNSYNFLLPPSTASFRHHIDTAGTDLASGNQHGVDGSSNPMFSTISLCTNSDHNSVTAMIKQERSAAAAAAASASCEDQITVTASSTGAVSGAVAGNPYDWQMISEGLFNPSSDGFLYQLPGTSSWPDFSDQFNDTGPG